MNGENVRIEWNFAQAIPLYTAPMRRLISNIQQTASNQETGVCQASNYALTLLAKDYWGLARARGSDLLAGDRSSASLLNFSSAFFATCREARFVSPHLGKSSL